MRYDTGSFHVVNTADQKSPRIVIEISFDDAHTRLWYLTSHDDCQLPGTVDVVYGCILDVSSITESLNLETYTSSIGTIEVSLVDVNETLTTFMQTQLSNGYGLRRKRLKIYYGYQDSTDPDLGAPTFAWSDYVEVATQLIDTITYQDGKYTILCSDIQRELRKNIFETQSTNITSSITSTDTLINVYDYQDILGNDKFQTLYHGNSYVDGTNGTEVGYIKIKDEVIKWTTINAPISITGTDISVALYDTATYYSSVTTNFLTAGLVPGLLITIDGFSNSQNNSTAAKIVSVDAHTMYTVHEPVVESAGNTITIESGAFFTGCTRGVLNTTAAAYEWSSTSTPEKQIKVEEYVYIRLPAVKLLYALLTGSLYGSAYTLPDSWHLGIDAQYIDSSSFVNIGTDKWDTSDDTLGVLLEYRGLTKEDGKTFIEREILQLVSLFMPIGTDGSLKLARLTSTVGNASPEIILFKDDIIEISPLQYGLKNVYNQFFISWVYDAINNAYTRSDLIQAGDSIDKYGKSAIKSLSFKGLVPDSNGIGTINSIATALTNRYSEPPLTITVTAKFKWNIIETGDVVWINVDNIRDYANPALTVPLSRSFEVTQKTTNWVNGTVELQLRGVVETTQPYVSTTDQTAIPDAWYTASGTSIISGLTLGVDYTISSSLVTIINNITLTGNANINSAKYYCDRDLTINSGVTVTFNKNVMLKVLGTLTINGTIDGSDSAGYTVGTGAVGPPTDVGPFSLYTSPGTQTAGTAGYFGTTYGQSGVRRYSASDISTIDYPSTKRTKGEVSKVSNLSIYFDETANELIGYPTNLRGSSGSGGAASGRGGTGEGGYIYNGGGDGGDGGGGILIIARNASFGVVGMINTSGGDGQLGDINATFPLDIIGGSGSGGAPGACIFVIDGSGVAPVIGGHITAAYGDTPDHVGAQYKTLTKGEIVSPDGSSSWAGYKQNPTGNVDAVEIVIILPKNAGSNEDENTSTSAALAPNVGSITLTERLNGTNIPNVLFSNIEVTVTDPSPLGTYDYANIYYRKQGNTHWVPGNGGRPGVANNEWVIVGLPADGTTYEVQARSVNTGGVENTDGPYETITLTDLENDDITTSLPMPNVTGLEIHGQGNDAEFTGRECWIDWRRTANDPYQLGSEPPSGGADIGTEEVYFDYYEVTIYDTSTNVLRTEKTKDNWYIYTWEKNAVDYYRFHGTVGANRQFTFSIVAVSKQNIRSETPARLTVNNPAPNISSVEVFDMYKGCSLNFTIDDDADYAYTEIHMSTTNGFTPSSPTTLVTTLSGRTDFVAITTLANGGGELATNTTYYVKLIPFDLFGGQGTTTTQVSFTTTYVENQDINSLSVGKLTAGTLAAAITYTNTLTISSSGNIHSGQTAYDTGTGFWLEANSGTPRFSIGNASGNKLTWNGTTLTVNGDVAGLSIASSGYIKGGQTAYDTGTGFWLGDVSGTKKLSIGNSSGNKLTWNGTSLAITGDITASSFSTATSGQRVSIQSSDNEIHFYGDRGDSTIIDLCNIGISSHGGDDYIIAIGDSSTTKRALWVNTYGNSSYWQSANGFCIYAVTNSTGTGIPAIWAYGGGSSGTPVGIVGESLHGYGIVAEQNPATNKAPFKINDSGSTSAPTHSADVGSFWVTSDGKLYMNTSGSTTWTLII